MKMLKRVVVIGLLVLSMPGLVYGQAIGTIGSKFLTKSPANLVDEEIVVISGPMAISEEPIPQRASVPDYSKTQIITALNTNPFIDGPAIDPLTIGAPGEPLMADLGQTIYVGVFFHLPAGYEADAQNVSRIEFWMDYNLAGSVFFERIAGDGVLLGSPQFVVPAPTPINTSETRVYAGQPGAPAVQPIRSIRSQGSFSVSGRAIGAAGFNNRVHITITPANGGLLSIARGTYLVAQIQLRIVNCPDNCVAQISPVANDDFYLYSSGTRHAIFPQPDRLADIVEIIPPVPRIPKLEPAQVGFYRTTVAENASMTKSLLEIPHASGILPLVQFGGESLDCVRDLPCTPVLRFQFPPFIAYREIGVGRFAPATNVSLDINNPANPLLIIGQVGVESSTVRRYFIAFLAQSDVPPSFDFNIAGHDYGWTQWGLTSYSFADGKMMGTYDTGAESVRRAFVRPELQISPERRMIRIVSNASSSNRLRIHLYDVPSPTPETAPISSMDITANVSSPVIPTLTSPMIRAMAVEILSVGGRAEIDSIRFLQN